MRRRRLQLAALVAVMGLMGVVAAAVAGDGNRKVREHLTGYEEVAAPPGVSTISTSGTGDFRARVSNDRIEYKISYGALEGNVLQSHIHLGARAIQGGISAFLCTNLGNGPPGTPLCPGPHKGTVEGTIEPNEVVGPSGQGIDPGEYGELLRAIRAGATYANVHSSKYPSGEIRAQLNDDDDNGHRDDD